MRDRNIRIKEEYVGRGFVVGTSVNDRKERREFAKPNVIEHELEAVKIASKPKVPGHIVHTFSN